MNMAQTPRSACIVGFGLILGLVPGCSKGGAGSTDPGQCRKISDPEPGSMMMGNTALPNALYAELRHSSAGTVVPVMLDGTGGNYFGESRAFAKCDPPGTYYVERAALVNAQNRPVATVQRVGSTYQVLYASGESTSVSSTGFTRYYASYSNTANTANPTVQSVKADSTMVRQGERISVTVSAMIAAEDCGLREAQFWLSTSPGSMASPPAIATIAQGTGSSGLRVPADFTAGTYFLEGRVYANNGRYTDVRKVLSTDTSYSFCPSGGSCMSSGIQVVPVTVQSNPDADRQAAYVVAMEASPKSLARCQTVSLSLKLKDDKALPASQDLKMRLGPMDNPGIVTATFKANGETASGSFVVPVDAPGGFWVAYPESLVDAAGNLGTVRLSGSKISVSGSPAPAVEAAVFYVSAPGEMMPGDGGVLPDLAMPLGDMRMPVSTPVSLLNINVLPTTSLTEGQKATVTLTWMDNANVGLK